MNLSKNLFHRTRAGLFVKWVLSITLFAPFLCACTQAQSPYVEHESFDLPTNGSEVRTTKRLEPYTVYSVAISSPYTLASVYQQETDGFLFFSGTPFHSQILFDGQPIHAEPVSRETDGYVGKLEFQYRGTGELLSLKLAADYRSQVRTAHVVISADRPVWERSRRWLNRLPLPLAFVILLATVALPFVAASAVVGRVQKRRLAAAALKEAQQEAQQEEEQKAVAEGQRKEQERLDANKRRRSREEKRQRRGREMLRCQWDESAKERVRLAEEQRQAALRAKVDALGRKFEWDRNLLDSDYRAKFVKRHLDEIPKQYKPHWARERDEILADSELTALLRQSAPHVLQVLDARLQAVCLAEHEAVNPSSQRHRPSPEQVRERAVRWAKTQAQDEAARVYAAIEGEIELYEALEEMKSAVRRRGDLTEEQQEKQISIIEAMAAARRAQLLEGKTYETDTPGQPKVL